MSYALVPTSLEAGQTSIFKVEGKTACRKDERQEWLAGGFDGCDDSSLVA